MTWSFSHYDIIRNVSPNGKFPSIEWLDSLKFFLLLLYTYGVHVDESEFLLFKMIASIHLQKKEESIVDWRGGKCYIPIIWKTLWYMQIHGHCMVRMMCDCCGSCCIVSMCHIEARMLGKHSSPWCTETTLIHCFTDLVFVRTFFSVFKWIVTLYLFPMSCNETLFFRWFHNNFIDNF